jgi:hypothetical protein
MKARDTGTWRKCHNKEIHNIHPYPLILRVIKSKMLIRLEHAASRGKMEN